MEGLDSAPFDDWFAPKLVAARTTLAATEADLRGSWEEVSFLTETVTLLPAPAEIAWVSVFLTAKNLELLVPPPDTEEIAAAGATAACHPLAPAGAANYAAAVLATVSAVVTGQLPRMSMDLLVASTGPLLEEDASTARHASAGLFTAVTYSFVRVSLALGLDPLETVASVRQAIAD